MKNRGARTPLGARDTPGLTLMDCLHRPFGRPPEAQAHGGKGAVPANSKGAALTEAATVQKLRFPLGPVGARGKRPAGAIPAGERTRERLAIAPLLLDG